MQPEFSVGMDVAKVFNDGNLYRGVIVNVLLPRDDDDDDNDEIWYSVRYEDGDCEDYETNEIKGLVKLHRDIENGTIDEWSIGNE